MASTVFKLVELVGTSPKSIEDAVNNALGSKVAKTSSQRWFQVVETRGAIKDGKVAEWQVAVRVGVKAD